jgi:hypothetical protein
MGYLHINNLYKDQRVLLFKEVYALEKVHGTSAHVSWHAGDLKFFSGGEKHESFKALFDEEALRAKFAEKFGEATVFVYGEAYGGKQQGMKLTYGDKLRFVVFDVKIGDRFVDVPVAEEIAKYLGLDFIPYTRVQAVVHWLDAIRDAPSQVAADNGCLDSTDRFGFCPPIREGVVLRPLHECTFSDGGRVIAKHKRPEFSERMTVVPVDAEKRKLMEDAQAVADEWVTEMRLTHVLDKLGNPAEMSATGRVIEAMVEDVVREAEGEIADTPAVRKAVGSAAARMFKQRVQKETV